MKTRIMSSAFLLRNNEVLLMHRDSGRKIAPNMWAAVGGHIEPDEVDNPRAACLREIEEETGILAEKVTDLKLRYITTRQKEDEIRISFTFIGKVSEKYDLPASDEGTLHWVRIDTLSDLPMTYSVKQTVLHWSKNKESISIFLGAVNSTNDQINWSEL